MTLTTRDKVIICVLAFAICIYGAYKLVWIPTGTQIAQLEEKKVSVEGLAGDISPLLEKSDKLKKEERELKESVENIKKLSGGMTTTNEEFLVFLGNSAKENGVNVTGFDDLGTTNDGGIYKAVFDFELKGKSSDINMVLEDIHNIGIKCSFGSVSYRQNEQHDYLKRFFDDLSELPWYQEPEEEEKTPEPEKIPDEGLNELLPEPEISDAPDTPALMPVPTPDMQTPPPTSTPVPEPDIPEQSPSEPETSEEDPPKTIEDRLNDLLENTASFKKPYEIVFLTNKQGESDVSYKEGQDMRLAVTVCFIMYQEPSMSTSFLSQMESDANGIL